MGGGGGVRVGGGSGGEQLIGEDTQNIGTLPFSCNNKTQDKKKMRKALIDEDKGA